MSWRLIGKLSECDDGDEVSLMNSQTDYSELPGIIEDRVQYNMAIVKQNLDSVSWLTGAMRAKALAGMEAIVRELADADVRQAWFDLHDGERTDH